VFDFLVVATGLFSKPITPSLPGKENFEGTICHSMHARGLANMTRGKEVLVLGGGRSANELAQKSIEAGAKNVTMVFRAPKWNLGIDDENKVLGYFNPFTFVNTRFATIFNTPMVGHDKIAAFQTTFKSLKPYYFSIVENA
jgi:cation diffusion facilitator CzcD-associated flavoprotein CzcO